MWGGISVGVGVVVGVSVELGLMVLFGRAGDVFDWFIASEVDVYGLWAWVGAVVADAEAVLVRWVVSAFYWLVSGEIDTHRMLGGARIVVATIDGFEMVYHVVSLSMVVWCLCSLERCP